MNAAVALGAQVQHFTCECAVLLAVGRGCMEGGGGGGEGGVYNH